MRSATRWKPPTGAAICSRSVGSCRTHGPNSAPRLKAEDPKARILVINMHDNPAYVVRVIQAGALGYVSKNAPPEQVLAAMARLSAALSYIDRETAPERPAI